MKLRAMETTDSQWIGIEFELPDPLMSNFYFPVAPDVAFRVDKSEKLTEDLYRYSNPHYVVVARRVG